MVGAIELGLLLFILGFLVGLAKTKSILVGIITGLTFVIFAPIILIIIAILTFLALVALVIIGLIILALVFRIIL